MTEAESLSLLKTLTAFFFLLVMNQSKFQFVPILSTPNPFGPHYENSFRMKATNVFKGS